jgi:hypothetical protein
MTHTQNTHNTRGNAKKNKKATKLILVFKPKININFTDVIKTASNSFVNEKEHVVFQPAPIVIPVAPVITAPFVFPPISPTLTSTSEMTTEDIIKRFHPGIIYDFLTEQDRIAIMHEIYVDLLIQQQNVDVISPGLRASENEDNEMPDLMI